jgi:hypothetical protein
MHSCKTTRDLMTELLSDGTSPPTHELLIELRCCRECRQEFEALKDTLRLTTGVIESVAPPEEYWPGYHAALRRKLLASRSPAATLREPSWLARFFRMSVPVPVPIALALLLLFGASLFYLSRAATPKQREAPLVVRVPVEVPVIQERLVTRTIYRDRYRSVALRKTDKVNDQSTLARTQTPSLVGFKPLEEIKLTVIKGGTRNDK